MRVLSPCGTEISKMPVLVIASLIGPRCGQLTEISAGVLSAATGTAVRSIRL